MAKSSKASKSSAKAIANIETEKIKQIGKEVKKEFYKTILFWLSIISIIFGIGLWQIYTKTIEQLKNLLTDRISEEFKQPMIRKTIEDVAANNAKQIFRDEILPEVIKFKMDIQSEMDKFEKSVIDKVDKIAKSQQSKLIQQYPTGYTVLGFPPGHRVIISKTYIPDGAKVDWSNTKIEQIDKDRIRIRLPDIKSQLLNLENFAVTLPNKIGSKACIINSPEWLLNAEIIAIENDLIVVAVGFEQKK